MYGGCSRFSGQPEPKDLNKYPWMYISTTGHVEVPLGETQIKKNAFHKCKNLVMIGSGMYPYSMFDVHRQYPSINQIGIEIDKNRCVISEKLIAASPCKDAIKIVNIDAIDYDYSWLGIDDLIFISVDVESKKMIEKIIKTSKAQVNICAPYDKTWLRNLIYSFS